MHSYRFKLNTFIAASMLLSLTSKGQIFNTPTSSGTPYPSPSSSPPSGTAYMNSDVGLLSNTSYTTKRGVGPGYLMDIAGWSSKPGASLNNGGFSFGYVNTTSFPITYTPSGIVPLTSIKGLDVEYLEDPTGGSGGPISGTGYIVLAYFNTALSEYECRLYEWVTASTVTLLSTTVLQFGGPYNRISVDASADGTKVAFAWSDGSSVYTAVAQLNKSTAALDFSPSLSSPTPAITFSNPDNCYVPDIAFRNDPVTGDEYLHYVFYDDNGTGGQLSEFKELFSTFYNATSTSYTPSGVDNQALSTSSFASFLWPHIDCPDVSTDEIWGYVYTDDQSTIKLHYLDPSVLTPNSIVINNGSLAGFSPFADITSYPNFSPVIAYDGDVSKWHIGWVTPAPVSYGYAPFAPVYVLIDNSLSLVSDADYLTVSPPTSGAFPYSGPPLLSFATHNTSLSYLYSVYPGESTSPTAAWSLFHKLHDVTNYSTFKLAATTPDLKAAPNPFYNTIHINMPASFLKQEMIVSVTDVLGRNMGNFKGPGAQVNDYLDKVSNKLAPGNYMLTATTGKNAAATFKIVKIAP